MEHEAVSQQLLPSSGTPTDTSGRYAAATTPLSRKEGPTRAPPAQAKEKAEKEKAEKEKAEREAAEAAAAAEAEAEAAD